MRCYTGDTVSMQSLVSDMSHRAAYMISAGWKFYDLCRPKNKAGKVHLRLILCMCLIHGFQQSI